MRDTCFQTRQGHPAACRFRVVSAESVERSSQSVAMHCRCQSDHMRNLTRPLRPRINARQCLRALRVQIDGNQRMAPLYADAKLAHGANRGPQQSKLPCALLAVCRCLWWRLWCILSR
jgi:hypothetical protein